jgi:hypothetical protein
VIKITGLVIGLIFLIYGGFGWYQMVYGPPPGVIVDPWILDPGIYSLYSLLIGLIIIIVTCLYHGWTEDKAEREARQKAWKEERCQHCGRKIH